MRNLNIIRNEDADSLPVSSEQEKFYALGLLEFERKSRKLINGDARYLCFKRIFDVAFSLVALILLLPLILILCIVVSIDTRTWPVYTQIRCGRFGRQFRIYKFRSMVGDSDNVEKYLSPEQLAEWHKEYKVDDDPRITRFGRLIRKLSIDEIPQFVNIVLGHLSVVGPRAITPVELRNYSYDEQLLLCTIRPGLTGSWQVGLRNEATFESGKRQQIELGYIKDMSFRLDLRIFMKTFVAMFLKRTGK